MAGMHRPTMLAAGLCVGLGLLLATPGLSRSQEAGTGSPTDQQVFRTPEMAAEALVAALATDSSGAFLRIFGSGYDDLVLGSDPVAGKALRRRAYDAARERLVAGRDGNDRIVLLLGAQEWPMPIPLVRSRGGWRFDTDAGAQKILERRIGGNELAAIDALQALVQAQRDYRAGLQASGRPTEYARYIQSSPGSTDGLWWDERTAASAGPSPLSGFVSRSGDFLEGRRPGDPFRGYYFRMLTGQGAHAPGGARSWLAGDRLTEGFAVIAWPMAYGHSGITSFMAGGDGRVLQKDLGEDTASLVQGIRVYDPDKGWEAVEP